MPHSSLKPKLRARNPSHVSFCDRNRKGHLLAIQKIRVPSSSSGNSSTRKGQRRQYRANNNSKGLLCSHPYRPDWSNLQCDILQSIPKKFQLVDLLQCRAVCDSWRSVVQTLIPYSSLKSISMSSSCPPLILWRRPCTRYRYNAYWFLDVTAPGRAALYQLNDSERILGDLGSCVGSSHGWFIFLDRKKKNENLCLFHPMLFPQAVARLPHISTPKEHHRYRGFRKVVLSAEPILAGGNYGIAVMQQNSKKKLLFARAGATQFTELDQYDFKAKWVDIICFKNCIYGVGWHNVNGRHMVAWDCTGENGVDRPRKVLDCQLKFRNPADKPTGRSTLHLVESQGELLLVSIQRPDPIMMFKLWGKLSYQLVELYESARCSNMCIVYKMDFKENEWVQMDSLGDHALFITEIHSTSVSTREFPQYKRNTVYFRHYIDTISDHVVGVFNLEDGSMEEIHTQHLRMENR